MDNNGFALGDGVPVGFGMALVQNERAVKAFISLTESQRRTVLDGARRVRSGAEMQAYVNALTGPNSGII